MVKQTILNRLIHLTLLDLKKSESQIEIDHLTPSYDEVRLIFQMLNIVSMQ